MLRLCSLCTSSFSDSPPDAVPDPGATPPSPGGSGRILPAALALLLGGAGAAAPAQEAPGHHREGATEIVLLGTTHFAGSATDRYSTGLEDVLSGRRQRELDAVAEQIRGWGPDRFFVECSPDDQAAFDSAYWAWRDGAWELSSPPGRAGRGEIHQLGFRTAAAAGLGGVECVDAEVVMPRSRARRVAAEHDRELLERHRRYGEEGIYPDSLFADHTVRGILRALNTDSLLWRNHRSYLDFYARMGSFDGTGARVRRESELEGATFAAPIDVPDRHMSELREVVRTVGARLVDEPGPETDYVVLLDRRAARAESGPGTGADTLSVAELGELIGRTSTTWIGFPEHHVGADMVAQWYKRNLRIYANIAHAVEEVEEGDDRVILLMGQAHVWTLRQFFRDSADFEVVPVEEIL